MFISYKYVLLSNEVISKTTRENVYEIVKKNNVIMDTKLSKIVDIGNSLVFDMDLYNIFKNLKPKDPYQLLVADRKLTDKINRYLNGNDDVFSAELVTSYYAFGNLNTSSLNNLADGYFIPQNIITKTSLYQAAKAGQGQLIWIPTYDYTKMFSQPELSKLSFSYRYLISAVKLINVSERTVNSFNALSSNIERPIAVINLKENLLDDIFSKSVQFKGAYYMIVSQDGSIISHSDKSKLTKKINAPWINEILNKRSGTSRMNFDNKNNIVCFDTSKVTGWTSMVVIPEDKLIHSIISAIEPYTLKVALTLMILSLAFAFLISGTLVKPIKSLIKAIKKTGEGNFDLQLPESPYEDEISQLIRRFNKMNYKISQLIEENYKVKIREKETEIMSLNTQLNPHFLYNTINIMNWIAIENHQTEISDMMVSLSEMLQYTVYNHNDITDLKDDMDWIKRYVFILEKRFEDRFVVNYSIEAEMYQYRVPKLLLQPLIENSIIHGFEEMDTGGIIDIKAWIEGDRRFFSITDNGKGMTEEEIKELLKDGGHSIGIKNVERRIKLIYGNEYGVRLIPNEDKGLTVRIDMPIVS